MTDLSHVDPKYRGMLEIKQQRYTHPNTPVNASQAQEFEMDAGAHWAMEATKLSYATGGNEGDWDPAHHPDDREVGGDPNSEI